MTLFQRLATAMLLVGVTGIGLSPAAEAHRDHSHHNRHSHKKQKAYDKGHRRGYRNAIGITRRRLVRPIYRSYSRCTAPWVYRRPGWFRFTRITTASGAVAVSGSICRHRSIHHV